MNYSTFLSGPGQRAPALRGSEAPRVHLLRPRRAEETRGAQVRISRHLQSSITQFTLIC